jgi:hypothetical protein
MSKILKPLYCKNKAIVNSVGAPLTLQDIIFDSLQSMPLKKFTAHEILYSSLVDTADIDRSKIDFIVKAVAEVYENEVVYGVIEALTSQESE